MGFRCLTEGCVDWGVIAVELRDFRAEKEWPICVELICWTEGGVELSGIPSERSGNKKAQVKCGEILYFWFRTARLPLEFFTRQVINNTSKKQIILKNSLTSSWLSNVQNKSGAARQDIKQGIN